MVFTRTCGSKLYARNNIHKNENCKYEILNHLYFGQNFAFWGTALGHFSQCFFFNVFCCWPTMVVNIFTVVPNHKKASNVTCRNLNSFHFINLFILLISSPYFKVIIHLHELPVKLLPGHSTIQNVCFQFQIFLLFQTVAYNNFKKFKGKK